MADATLAETPEAFLAGSPAAGWVRAPLAGDASGRRYERLTGPGGRTAILMDARSEPGSLAPFLRIGAHLRALGLRAPEVLAEGRGLLLLEDLGPHTMAAWLTGRPGESHLLYGSAIDLLARLQIAPPPGGLMALTPERAAGMIAPLWEHYAPMTDSRRMADLTFRLREALERHAPDATVLSLRDYHAENLIWRPDREGTDREGTDRLGLLDFQDAVLAPPEYDLASLLRDARRDTDPALRAAMTRRFAEATGRDAARVAAAAAVLGVQRNLRILGIFARLAHERGKPAYLRLLPRVHAHLLDDLAHPALAPLADLARAAVPSPGSLP
ncbi:aminoglycoside phosphotransferase family protein [Rubellimicrobium aerolatum]|uniref:Aminoglycoside phosphotransferase family protein n=1 Tax=Rubellimicrobium aerolatum TaxID=490979 RepID=A0ABW0S9Y6_9RHOB|nr:phosphotransferase [Rubellimicrobium aerolatum]MBP1805130.1 aminoglycoside/choline kinase family phosphotransferase [Rubellimicrobium aerolatum]